MSCISALRASLLRKGETTLQRHSSSLWKALTARSFATSKIKQANKAIENAPDSDDNRKRWKIPEIGWKVVVPVVAAAVTYLGNERVERKRIDKELNLKRIQSQIRDLYGPLYGNRLVSETSYRAVMKNHRGLKKYLHEARLKKDADMIRRWRSYVWNVLFPLDKAAVDLILKNGHLIANHEFPREFEELLIHTAKMEFVMELWKSENGELEPTAEFDDDDFLEETNASCLRGRSRVLQYAKEKYEELRKEQKSICLETWDVNHADAAILSTFGKILK